MIKTIFMGITFNMIDYLDELYSIKSFDHWHRINRWPKVLYLDTIKEDLHPLVVESYILRFQFEIALDRLKQEIILSCSKNEPEQKVMLHSLCLRVNVDSEITV